MNNFSRREFLRSTSLAVAGTAFAAPFINGCATTPKRLSDIVLHASIGAGGQANSDIGQLTAHKRLKLVAVADVDLNKAAKLKERFPDLRIYQDWRVLLEKEKSIHSINVSTPDHMHGPIGMSAMHLGKHVYIQKPLAHDIYEVRKLTEFAAKKKLVTQMGIQIHSASDYRRAVRLIQEGAIGKVKEVHTWCGKGWGDLTALPDRRDTPPSGLDWNQWVGVAADRPFIGDGYYHPGNWRKRLDFGTATFGDMGCHILDPVFGALNLGSPLSVRSEGEAPNGESWALDTLIRYVFPGTPYPAEKTVPVTWYDGERRPPAEIQALLGSIRFPGKGSICLGTKGQMLLPHIGMPILLPLRDFSGFIMPQESRTDHYHEFAEAVLGNGKTSTPFEFSGALTESVLLGPLATRFPNTTLNWNGAKAKFTNVKEANAFLRRKYRPGFAVRGLS